MTAPAPLIGIDLIDCARANVSEGIAVAARQCGYGEDTVTFEREVKQACEAIGVDITKFEDIGKDYNTPGRNLIE